MNAYYTIERFKVLHWLISGADTLISGADTRAQSAREGEAP